MGPSDQDRPQLFIVGIHDSHRRLLSELARRRSWVIHDLLSYGSVRRTPRVDIDALLEQGEAALSAADPAPSGIATYWDFPSSCVAPMLARRHGLPGPALQSVVTFEHKIWSRHVQQAVIPEVVPRFAAVDPASSPTVDDIGLQPPFWLKPVKSYSAHLGFRIADAEDLARALGILRRRIGRLGAPFDRVLQGVDMPEAIAGVGGRWAIAEEMLHGAQCTLEGHVCDGEVEVHGVFDIHRRDDGSTFTHYSYPSTLPAEVQTRMAQHAGRLVKAVGYADAPFNIEFFCDHERDEIGLLEVNPRISQQHSDLMAFVDGTTNLEVMASLALGEAPRLQPGCGDSPRAAHYFVRHDDDAVVTAVPSDREVAALAEDHAPCAIDVEVHVGDRLSELEDQGSYSYELASVRLGGTDDQQLAERFRSIQARLGIALDPVEAG